MTLKAFIYIFFSSNLAVTQELQKNSIKKEAMEFFWKIGMLCAKYNI